jgi:hypothetical protein
MRGLALAFWMGSAFTLGWCLSRILCRWLHLVGIAGWVALAIALIVAFVSAFGSPGSKTRMILDRITFACVAVALFASGMHLASFVAPSGTHLFALALIAAASIWCGARCFSAYKHFADEFARATWNDFLSLQVTAVAKP